MKLKASFGRTVEGSIISKHLLKLEMESMTCSRLEVTGKGLYWYPITNSPFVFPYISYRSGGEKLLKYQQN